MPSPRVCGLFEGMRELENAEVLPIPAHDLEADEEAFSRALKCAFSMLL